MLEHLFGSKTRLKLMRLFFRKPDESFYVRELTRLLDVQINAIRRELNLLIKSGLVKEAVKGKNRLETKAGSRLRKYYQIDRTSILFPELQALLVKAQILGEQVFTKEIIDKVGSIKLFLLTGQFTAAVNSPSDILIVGDIKQKTLARLITKYEKEFGFEIRYTVMTEEEFFDRRNVMDKFLFSLFEAENMKVINELNI
jgi:hypothetical protein